MKILFLPPLTRKINARTTSARPRLVFELAKAMTKKGHQVSVLGTKDSKIKGVKIIPIIPKGFYSLMGKARPNPFYAHNSYLVKQLKKTESLSGKYDVIHNHCYPEFINLILEKEFKAPLITTLHMAMTKEIDEVLSLFPQTKIIAPSESAQKLSKKTKIYKMVYHGVDTDLYKYKEKKEDYLLWIGRLGKDKDQKGRFLDHKGVRWAIKLAEKTNSKLLMGGNVEDMDFFNQDVKPHLSSRIKWISDTTFEQPLKKKEVVSLMQNAKALLMMTQLEEAFGLVVAEAMSCGTPVIGFRKGGVAEIIKNNETGFIVKPNDFNALQNALKKIDKIKPKDCRERIENIFSLDKMMENYEAIYKDLIKKI